MSAITTKKLGGDYATQLTFPAVFELQAKASNLASQFYPEVRGRSMELLTGSGLQQDYHEQKRLDANRRCLNGVRDNAASMARYLSSHANYIVPKPVLGQRIYANPSNGNQADIYSSRPIQWNQSMSGGVLRTEEGQKWGMDKLKERIPQLDAIKAAKDAFLLGVPMASTGAESVGISDITTKVELYGLLNRVESDVEQGVVNNKTVEKSQSLLKLLFAWTPYGEIREVEEVMDKIEYIKRTLEGIAEQGEEGVAIGPVGEAVMKNADYLGSLYEKMFQYLTRMNGVLNRPRKEREKASSIFIKSLGFSELEKKLPSVSAKIRRQLAAAQAANPNADPDGEEEEEDEVLGDDGKQDDEDDDEDQPPPAPPRDMGRAGPYAESSGLSSFPVVGPPSPRRPPRGDKDEAEPEFDEDQHQVYGDNSGAYLREERPAEPAARSNMESAQMSEEEHRQLAPEFEPAVAAAAAASSGPSRPPIIPPVGDAAAAAPAPKLRKPEVGPPSALTGQELADYQDLQRETANYPDWLQWNSLHANEIEETYIYATSEGLYKQRKQGMSDDQIARSLKAKFRQQVAVLKRMKFYEDKIAKFGEAQKKKSSK